METVPVFSPWWVLCLITLYILVGYVWSFFPRKKLSPRNKAVLVTGCSSGFGYMLCQRLAKLGYKVFAGFSSLERKGAQELKSFSPNIRVLRLDVRDKQSVENASKIVSEELQERELWAVVNNAGITHSSELEWTSIDTITNIVDVNTFGTVRVTRQFLPLLKKSRGRIVNVTSITGSASGFGYLLCQRLAKLGYRVFASCSSLERKGAQELKSFSPNIRVLQLDVRDKQSVENASKIVSEELKERELWAVVNNAGIAHSCEIEWTSIDTILNFFDVNALGMVRVTQQFLPLLKKSRGRIVNVTSAAAEVRIPGFGAYTMSKVAAKCFNDAIRLEFKRWGIKVISVAPYLYGTKLAAIDNAVSLTRKEWQKCKRDLGIELEDEYLERFIKLKKWFLSKMTNPNIDEVAECMEDAITSTSPKLCYYPGNITIKLLGGLLSSLPSQLQDCMLNLLMPRIKKKSI